MKYNVPVHVRSSFNEQPGTLVTNEDGALEGMVVSGVAYDKAEARVHVVGVDDKPGVAAELFERIAEKNISVDMIVQNVTTDADPRASITFTLGKTDLARAKPWIEQVGLHEAHAFLHFGVKGITLRPFVEVWTPLLSAAE